MTGATGPRPVLTLLYVPANRPDRIHKALAGTADGVIIDLEDAVPPHGKDVAREQLLAALDEAKPDASGAALQVRINALGTPWHEGDLELVDRLPGHIGIRLPKCESADAVRHLVDRVRAEAPEREVHVLIESALGVEQAFAIASVLGVTTLGIGEADLRADLGVTDEQGLLWARCRIVNAATAAGLPAPLMAAWTDVSDGEGLIASCRLGRSLGFGGRSAIHPGQISSIRSAFLPTPDEVRSAREVFEAAARAASETGSGAIALPDGRFVDAAVVRQASRILGLAPSPSADEESPTQP
jgi:citrate lyase subunit beta/citryl-CoA lyase